MAELGSLLEGGIVGLAVAGAAEAVVEPALEPARQEAEKAVKARIIDFGQLAQAVAQSLVVVDDVIEHSGRHGYAEDELRMAVQLALRAPGVSEALTLYRRRTLDGVSDSAALARLHHAFAKAQIEYQYWPQLVQTAEVPLDVAVVANAIQRGILKAPFALPYDASPPEGNIPAFPQSDLDPVAEAAAAGYDERRLFIETALSGNPPGPEALVRAYFRGAINLDDVKRGLNEGRARAEWLPAYTEDSRAIPSPVNFVEGRVRNWITEQQMLAGTQRHGMTDDDAELLFLIHGRPLSWHQVWIGLLRGGVYDGPIDEIDPAFLKALQESDIRPEWYNLAWAQRYGYPSLFQLNALVKANAIPAATAMDWAAKVGLAPEVVDALGTFWKGEQGGTTSGAKPKEYTYSQIHQAWRAGQFSDAQALAELEAINYPAAKAATLLATWKHSTATGSGA